MSQNIFESSIAHYWK